MPKYKYKFSVVYPPRAKDAGYPPVDLPSEDLQRELGSATWEKVESPRNFSEELMGGKRTRTPFFIHHFKDGEKLKVTKKRGYSRTEKESFSSTLDAGLTGGFGEGWSVDI
jgi:hypothetical protein